MSARRGRAAWALVGVLALGGLAAGCDLDDEDDVKGETSASASSTSAGDAGVAEKRGTGMEWETKTDPVEGAFTIELPKGWKNDAYVKREGIFTATIATAESPDGADALFYGDPKMPRFVDPQAVVPQNRTDPNTRIEAYRPAERFLPEYVKGRFSKLPGFKITNVASEPELVEKNRQSLQKVNIPIHGLHSARVDFDFQQGGSTRHGSLFGSTLNMGIIWSASVAGIVSSGDPSRLRESLFHVFESQKVAPEWKEKERIASADRQRQHEYIMAQIAQNTEVLQSNHAGNMATLNGMAVRHQARMDAIHAAGDASTAAYKARDIASDNNQRGFLNYINDEHTVSGASGRTFQVDNKYERYYVNKSDNTYIGVKGGTTLSDMNGVNPGDYEEAKVVR